MGFTKQLTMNPSALQTLFILVLLAACFQKCDSALFDRSSRPRGTILVVGATGSTGFRALQGLLDVGYRPNQLRIVTRNAKSPKSKGLKRAGFSVVQADLERAKTLRGISKGCVGCYVHSTSSDTAELDTAEAARAQNLANSIVSERNQKIQHIVYNSAAAGDNHGVERISQKHEVEDIFARAITAYNQQQQKRKRQYMAFTSLRATIFMEELWKIYTRPQILNGVYPLPVKPSQTIYLVSVRDLGRMAGSLIDESTKTRKDETKCIQKINVAGDCLDPVEIARAFAKAQSSPCYHQYTKDFALLAWCTFPELYEQIQFLQTSYEVVDIAHLKERFPGLITSFSEFLEETKWGDRNRVFDDFSKISNLVVS